MMILEYLEDSLQHIYKRQYVVNNNKLDQYLAIPTAPYGTNILQWWKYRCRRNSLITTFRRYDICRK